MSATESTTSRRHRAPRGQGDALRGEILAAARDLLAETGDRDAVSVRAVAERVGITTPSIYRHFRDKEDLLDAVCAEVFSSLADVLEEAANKARDPLEVLYRQGKAFVHFALANPEQYRMTFMAAGDGPHKVDDVLTERCFSLLLSTVAACAQAGYFPPLDDGGVKLGLRLFAAVHGLATLLITKMWLPWGDTEEAIDGVIGAAIAGSIIVSRLRTRSVGGFARSMSRLVGPAASADQLS
jgi:AcrR family transcriptional regulator